MESLHIILLGPEENLHNQAVKNSFVRIVVKQHKINDFLDATMTIGRLCLMSLAVLRYIRFLA